MLIISDNLRDLNKQYGIVSNPDSFDQNSFTLHLHDEVKFIRIPANECVQYGVALPDDWIVSKKLDSNGVTLKPGEAFLGASRERVNIPAGYFGLVQTKGSLARLFISATCSDGQVEPGYNGLLTLEFTNAGNVPVKLNAGQQVAQLFIFRTSTKKGRLYAGRYQNANGPTHYKAQ